MLREAEAFDVLILGGGPAGLSTALHLARDYPELAARTIVLEKGHYPRPKLCAGGLVVDAEVILSRLGLDVTQIPHVDAQEVRFDFEGKGLRLRVANRHALRVVRRDEFDAWLARKAEERGIEIRQGITVKYVDPGEDGVNIETDTGSFRALAVVGADGANGVTRRCVMPNAAIATARVLELLVPEPPPAHRAGQSRHRKGVAYFDFFPVPRGIAGYTWDFPTQVDGKPMRCWGIYDTNLLANLDRPALKQPLREAMRQEGLELDRYEVKGHPIRWFDPSNPLSAPRVLLAGDAAGSDPIFGEGISIALGYGALAASELGEAFQRGDLSFHGYKQRILRSGLGQTLLMRWVITNIIYTLRWRWFQILLWRILKPVVAGAGLVFVVNWGKRLR